MGMYRIWIGADSKGRPLIGAPQLASAVVTEQIWPSQMVHRCTIRTGGKIQIVTPTEAARLGCEILAEFPRADGRFSRR
jgi:hypothetical protein